MRKVAKARGRAGLASIVQFESVGLRYGTGAEVLRDLDFTLSEGSFYFLAGASGAGKTSLLKLLYLAQRPTRGRIRLFGHDLADAAREELPPLRRRIGVVFQDFRLIRHLSAFDNVALPLVLRGMRRGEAARRVRPVLERLGLGARGTALPGELSAGEQQRVGIARAVVAEPRLLVADEPTGNLDPTLAAEIMALFASLPDQGTSVLVASHDLGLVKRMRKRVLVLDHGRLADDIAPEDLADE